MPVVSKLVFVPFTPSDYNDSQPNTYQSDRDTFRGEVRGGLNAMLALVTGILHIRMHYSKEKYARIIVWCLGVLLDGWPWHIPFTNLSDIIGGAASLRLLRDLMRDGRLKFIPAPWDVRQRALHDPGSVLPDAMATTKLPPLPPTIQTLIFSLEHFRDLITPRGNIAPPSHRQPVSNRAHLPAPAEERVLHPENLEPVLTLPIGPDASRPTRERRQRCDVNKARHRPVSNPEGKPLRARKVGALTSRFVLDRPTGSSRAPTSGSRVMKPLSQHRMPVMVDDDLGGYAAPGRDDGEVEDIESFSDSEDERDGRHQAKRRRRL